MRLHNVSIHRNSHQNRSINECARKIKAKIRSLRVFFVRCRRTYVLNKCPYEFFKCYVIQELSQNKFSAFHIHTPCNLYWEKRSATKAWQLVEQKISQNRSTNSAASSALQWMSLPLPFPSMQLKLLTLFLLQGSQQTTI